MSDERWLVVGLGAIGQRHVKNLRTLYPGAGVAALRHEGGGGRPTLLLDGEFFEVDAALDWAPTAAIISGPSSARPALAATLIEAGVPVFLEKPLAADSAGAGQIVSALSRYPVPAMVGYNLRFHPAVTRFRDEVRRGLAGEIWAIEALVGQHLSQWRKGRDYRTTTSAQEHLGGGVLRELSHEIDLCLWIGGRVSGGSCWMGNVGLADVDVDDWVQASLWFESGGLASLRMDMVSWASHRVIRAVGPSGEVVCDLRGGTVTHHHPDGKVRPLFKADSLALENTYLEELRHFGDCVSRGVEPCVTVADGVEVVRVIEVLEESARRDGCA